ncbi:MAG: diacylglycerol kinase family protein [Patescibacteria group bacterium]
MYHYFFDSSLHHKRFQHNIARIETRITDLGIKGKVTRLTPLHDLREAIEQSLAQGTRTLIAIGNDYLLSRIASVLRHYPKCVLGIIPLGNGPFSIARNLGIPEGMSACDTIAARRIEVFDAGIMNNEDLFISVVEIRNTLCSIECNAQYYLTPLSASYTTIQNLNSFRYPHYYDNPADGKLSIFICLKKPQSWWRKRTTLQLTHCTAKKITVFPLQGESTATVDGFKMIRLPFTTEVLPHHFNFIVGKTRLYEEI